MKEQNHVLEDQVSTNPEIKEVRKLMRNWRKCLPILLGDLFTKETETGTERYDTYKLHDRFVKKIKNFNNSHGGNNVETISVIMGKRNSEELTQIDFSAPSNDIFIPILEVKLYKARDGGKVHHYYLQPQNKAFDFLDYLRMKNKNGNNLNSKESDEHLSPKVAELFIVKWQSLGDTELINAFDCLTPESTIKVTSDGSMKGQMFFTQQKMLRVKRYNYSVAETNAIFINLNEMDEVNFFMNMGAGLAVADFHPFSFRPVVRIEEKNLMDKSTSDIPPTYYDTSRPCPPFCGQEN